ncbi:hypothetical protein AMIS_20320 [Actinoplanes missouriensis 431]|uniref:Uncharacterized protein n=1 Tax=Actinoplanes missouriensis (strain ATCC 14538 / DSM 43046 / CBS 188.64 / JCM 3121 / NBRC 102363 / NCIMB 12654 / NRRL B-3342 / UNCC 431) TaxID=512565 RepID=I0H2L5_ACTM4|nr:hypothetical protein [Actinoplanes missouriensis]BAL87252.1 hypothetical protein AMIS_20320 [Actinoplanes missouriensis 431]
MHTAQLRAPADYELSPAEAEQLLRSIGPVHALVIDALNPDGSVRDQTAFDQLAAIEVDELDDRTARDVDLMLAHYGIEVAS